MAEIKLVVIGSTGSGKSSLCNVLAGMDSMESQVGGFPVSEKLSACTFQTTCRHVRWMGQGEKIMLIDTPGLDDPEGKDTQHIAEMVDKLKEVRHVNLFLIIFNAQRPRMDSSLKSMFKIFQGIFGSGFWSNTAIVFSRWAFDARNEKQRQRESVTTEGHSEMVNNFLRSNFNLNRIIPCLFVDSCYLPENATELTAFNRETQRLHDILMKMKPYECKDFEMVLSEMDNLTLQKDTAVKERNQAITQTILAREQKQTAVHEKYIAEEKERLAVANLEKVKAQLSAVHRESLEKLQNAYDEKQRIQQEVTLIKDKAEKAKRDVEDSLREIERKASEDRKLMEMEFKSLEARKEMEENIQKENEKHQEKLRLAQRAEMDARHEAELLEERQKKAERETAEIENEANNNGLFNAVVDIVGTAAASVFPILRPVMLLKRIIFK